ncbi:MAG: threonine/serine exporter family protein [Clostridia bacterium]|nr:threonine/serine exporter family protein [Clostridia bacterium]
MEAIKIDVDKESLAETVLRLALDVGEGMLKNGGEVSRVENTIERICRAWGAEHVEVFSIVSMINATVHMPDGTRSSQMRRIRATGTDMYKLELLNELSREICQNHLRTDEVDARVKAIKRSAAYPRWAAVPASAVAASAFAVFFGGGWVEAVVALFIGALLGAIELFAAGHVNELAKTVLSAFVAGILSFAAALIVSGTGSGIIMIGTIMLLVPGVAFGTALRDLLCGDLIAGGLKTLQSILTALMIAFGYLLSMAVMGGAL